MVRPGGGMGSAGGMGDLVSGEGSMVRETGRMMGLTQTGREGFFQQIE